MQTDEQHAATALRAGRQMRAVPRPAETRQRGAGVAVISCASANEARTPAGPHQAVVAARVAAAVARQARARCGSVSARRGPVQRAQALSRRRQRQRCRQHRQRGKGGGDRALMERDAAQQTRAATATHMEELESKPMAEC